MSDKKKLDEAAILNVQDKVNGMTGESTFVADDVVELVKLLKAAGVESAMYNGAATLSVETKQGTGSVTSRVQAPDLRSIMTLLEPEFQQVGDEEAQGSEVPQISPESPAENPDADSLAQSADDYQGMSDALRAQSAERTLGEDDQTDEAQIFENTEDDVFEILDLLLGDDDVDQGAPSTGYQEFDYGSQEGASFAWTEVPAQDATTLLKVEGAALQIAQKLTEGNELEDYGVHKAGDRWFVYAVYLVDDSDVDESTTMIDYPGIADRRPTQPKTKMVPARSGDNPLAEATGHTGSFRTWINTPFDLNSTDEVEVTVHYHFDGGDFDTGLDNPSVANHGSTMTIEEVLTDSGEDLLDHLTGSQLEGLEQEAMDFINDRDVREAKGPKSFMDYVREAELNELTRGTVMRYVDKVNQSDHSNADRFRLSKRGRGLTNAQNKVHWKDANVLATESSLLDEFRRLNEAPRYEIQGTMCNYSIVDTTTGETVESEIRSGNAAYDYLKYWEHMAKRDAVDIEEMDEDREAFGRALAKKNLRKAAIKAKADSEEGYVQHIDRVGDVNFRISDWMSDDTVLSYSNGRCVGGEDPLEEGELNEISQEVKDRYRDKARGNNQLPYFKQASDYFQDIGDHHDNDEMRSMAAKTSRLAKNREQGIARSYPKEEPRRHKAVYQAKTGTYDIEDTHTGEIVDRNVANSGGHAMSVAANWDHRTKKEVSEARHPADTEEGAIEALAQMSQHDMTGATAEPDPMVKNVWLVTHDRGRSIVYLDQMDFEDIDESVDEAYGDSRWRSEYERKANQFGPAFYLNTDCGYASLNDLETHDYFHDGVVVLEIDRNGKKGLNYVAGFDDSAVGTEVTCVTQTSTGQKYRPGRVMLSFSLEDLKNSREAVEAKMAQLGVSPTKKLSVKTFD